MNTKKKNMKERIDSLESKFDKSQLPYLNEDFEEITMQLKNILIFLAYKGVKEPHLKNIN